PESSLVDQIRVMDACVRGGPGRVDWAGAVRARALAVLSAGQSLAAGLAQPRCAEAAYGAVIASDAAADAGPDRLTATFGLAGLLLARGRVAEAAAAIDASVARGDGGASWFLLASAVAPALASRAADMAAGDAARYGADDVRAPAERRWTLGAWEAARGRPTVAATMAAVRSGVPPLLARSAAAWAALAAGDSVRAIARLDTLLALPQQSGAEIGWGIAEPRGAERLALARLLLARRQPERALAVLGVLDSPASQAFVMYLPASLALRAEAAAAENGGAAPYRARLAALRGGAVAR
ncbi:MAG TPA: hypothetical protein VGD56_05235, partial [Gemmatirosa sp.]